VAVARAFAVLLLLWLAPPGCATRVGVPPEAVIAPDSPALSSEAPFEHTLLDRVQSRFVDATGHVDYEGLRADPTDLHAYYALLREVSPDSQPARFPDANAELAYWINAYNAAVLEAVLLHYPIASVKDVRPPRVWFFVPRLAGFFYFQQIELGGDKMSLRTLEHRIIRKRYDVPQIHFAINCASESCPRLPQHAFSAGALEVELERESIRFFSEPRNLSVDRAAKQIRMSPIMDWYHDDYTEWMELEHPDAPATLRGFAALYAPEVIAAELRSDAEYEVVFSDYDWTLNGQIVPE
jgi:hypothetical protein